MTFEVKVSADFSLSKTWLRGKNQNFFLHRLSGVATSRLHMPVPKCAALR